MLFFILIVAVILLIDLSGGTLDEKITPLIYISSEEEEKNTRETNPINSDVDLSPEDLATKAQNQIFGDKKGEEEDD